MAVQVRGEQLIYSGKGPLDSKALVKKYTDLLDPTTWEITLNGNTGKAAYNGMQVSVWLDKENPERNGVYYLFDPACNTTLKNPDVTNPDNWHKLTNSSEVYLKAQTYSKDEVDTAINAVSTDLNEIKLGVDSLKAITAGIGNEGDIYLSVIDAIDKKIAANNADLPIATADKIGGIKSSTSANKISVLEDGSAEVNSLNVNKLTQTEGELLIFDGQSITI